MAKQATVEEKRLAKLIKKTFYHYDLTVLWWDEFVIRFKLRKYFPQPKVTGHRAKRKK